MRIPPGPVLAAIASLACATPTSPASSTSSTATTNSSTPAVYSAFNSTVTVSMDGSTVVLRSNGVPDHKSPYFGASSAQYEAPQAGMVVNPNLIQSQNFVMRVPASPSAATPSDTPLGPIGMAVNGVALFNQYAAGRSPLGQEILTFDRYNGHPQNTGMYHYHLEPLWITSNHGASAVIGVLLDGFPVYGPKETDGSLPANLDSCNGHTHATLDFPQGTYHYHVTASTPYIAGCFHGAPGTIG